METPDEDRERVEQLDEDREMVGVAYAFLCDCGKSCRRIVGSCCRRAAATAAARSLEFCIVGAVKILVKTNCE